MRFAWLVVAVLGVLAILNAVGLIAAPAISVGLILLCWLTLDSIGRTGMIS